MFSQNVITAYTFISYIYMNMGTHTQNVEGHKGTKNKLKI